MSSNLRKPGLCPSQAGIKELWEDLMNLMESVVFHKPSQANIKMSAFPSPFGSISKECSFAFVSCSGLMPGGNLQYYSVKQRRENNLLQNMWRIIKEQGTFPYLRALSNY